MPAAVEIDAGAPPEADVGALPPNPFGDDDSAPQGPLDAAQAWDLGAPDAGGRSPEDDAGERVDPLALGTVPPNPFDRSVVPRNPFGTTAGGMQALGFAISFEQRRYNLMPERDLVETLRHSAFTVGRTVGNTSVNFHVHLSPTVDGGYKPAEARHPEHYRAEVAAFHINQLLGLERVPPAVFRRVSEAELPQGRGVGVQFDRQGFGRGAMIYWVPVLRHVAIEGGAAASRWQSYLRPGTAIPDTERTRCEEISTMIVFDYLIGNWDRWHGTNTLCDGTGHLVYRDNNAGFQEPFRGSRYDTVRGWLLRTQRFSRNVIDHARALTFESIERAMAPEADEGRPLLTPVQIRGVLTRRDELMTYVEALVAEHGEGAVYAFP